MATESSNECISGIAYQIGIIAGQLFMIRDDLIMGNKDALQKVNDLIKFIETELASKFHEKNSEPQKLTQII